MICPNCGIVGSHTNCTPWVQQIAALQAERDSLAAQVARLREALSKSRDSLNELHDLAIQSRMGRHVDARLYQEVAFTAFAEVRATLAADPGQAAERVRALEDMRECPKRIAELVEAKRWSDYNDELRRQRQQYGPQSERQLNALLSVRTKCCLQRHGYWLLPQIAELSDFELLGIRNFGKKALEEVRAALTTPGKAQE